MAAELRVAHVMHGLMMGGLEQVVVRLCEAGRSLGIAPHVIAFGPNGPVRDLLEERGIPLTWLGDVPGMSRGTLGALSRVLRSHAFEVIHAHDLGPWLNVAAASALAPPAKRVVTFHQIAAPRGVHRLLATAAAWSGDALVACGDEVLGCVRGWAPSGTRATLIGNGVPIGRLPTAGDRERARARLSLPPSATVFGYLGRLHPEKGGDLLVDAFLRRFAHREDLHLALIGRGDLEPQLRRAAAGHPRVHFLGERLDASSLLPAFDLYVHPSRREGRSLALLEAMAAGLPTIAQALPAIREIHVDGETALLVPPGEAPDLATAMTRLLDDVPLRHRLGSRARAHVQQFSVEEMSRRYADLYLRLSGAPAAMAATVTATGALT